MFVAYLAVDSTQANETNEMYGVIFIMTLIPMNFFLFASLFSVTALFAEIFGHSSSRQIPGTCDIQACCYCDLNLGDKCTYFTDQVIHPKKYHVRSFHRYFFCLYYKCITSLNVKLYLTLRRHINQNQVPQVAQRECSEEKEICNGIAFRVPGFHSLLFATYL